MIDEIAHQIFSLRSKDKDKLFQAKQFPPKDIIDDSILVKFHFENLSSSTLTTFDPNQGYTEAQRTGSVNALLPCKAKEIQWLPYQRLTSSVSCPPFLIQISSLKDDN